MFLSTRDSESDSIRPISILAYIATILQGYIAIALPLPIWGKNIYQPHISLVLGIIRKYLISIIRPEGTTC